MKAKASDWVEEEEEATPAVSSDSSVDESLCTVRRINWKMSQESKELRVLVINLPRKSRIMGMSNKEV